MTIITGLVVPKRAPNWSVLEWVNWLIFQYELLSSMSDFICVSDN
jgi:hypothetical protein